MVKNFKNSSLVLSITVQLLLTLQYAWLLLQIENPIIPFTHLQKSMSNVNFYGLDLTVMEFKVLQENRLSL